MIFNEESMLLIASADPILFESLVEEAGLKIEDHALSDIDVIVQSIDEAITNLTPITDMFKKKGRQPLTADERREMSRRQKLAQQRQSAPKPPADVANAALRWPEYQGMRVHPQSDEAVQMAYQEMIKKIAEDQGYIIKVLDGLKQGIDGLVGQLA
jgi:hypothetical protein